MSFQTWSRGRNGERESINFWVDHDYGQEVEPTATVQVSIEFLTQMLIELGYFKDC